MADNKKRFDVDFYKTMADRKTSHETIIRGDNFSDVLKSAVKIAKEKGLDYVEFHHRDFFIGSTSKKDNYKFKNGKDYQKNPLKQENKMAKKKNRLQESNDREAQKKKIFETIAGTKSYRTPIDNYKNGGKGIDLKLLAESGFKFATEDKDFLHKTKQELDKENKEIKQLNESFLGIGNFAVVGNPFGKKTAVVEEVKVTLSKKDAQRVISLLEQFKKSDVAKKVTEMLKKAL